MGITARKLKSLGVTCLNEDEALALLAQLKEGRKA
jgi:hypothetical protein